MSQTEKLIITIHILPNISGSKGNQTVKFGQFIKSNMRNIFHEFSCTICDGEISPRPLLKIKIEQYLDHQSEHLYCLFLLLLHVIGLPKYIEIEVLIACLYLV